MRSARRPRAVLTFALALAMIVMGMTVRQLQPPRRPSFE
jgi:hypothetical protein